MALSVISRHQGILLSTSDRSNLLQAGFTQKTFRKLITQYPSHSFTPQISSYMYASVESVIPTISNASLDITFPLDRLSSGNGLIHAYQLNKNETYKQAYEALYKSVDLQLKNEEGSLWYYVYPNYTYLDGMYSLAPFFTLYSTISSSNSTSSSSYPSTPDSKSPSEAQNMVDFVVKQLDLAWNHTYQEKNGLLVHGYDASKRAVWANPVTGASEWVWGRSLGWFCMALLDTLESLPSTTGSAQEWLTPHFQTLMHAVVAAVDSKTGAWWQIVNQPGRQGNYIESSASAMFVYTLLRGARLGYLDSTAYDAEETGKRAYRYLIDTFVVDNGNGTLGWNGTVSVCSLNSSASYEVRFHTM
jgi:rhamnogalacturonyl hydrolase YesR